MRRIEKPGIGSHDEQERARLVRTYDVARTAGDADAMADAALGLAAQQAWGAVHLRPGAAGIWWVGRDDAPVAVRESKGLQYLRLLVANPGVDVPVASLSDAIAGHDGRRAPRQSGLELVDHQALAAYRERLREIDAELDQASEWSDADRVASLGAERDALLAEIRRATGASGRLRTTGSTDERARVAVRKAIAAAVARLREVDAEMGRLLTDTVNTGASCRYEPDPHRPVAWVLAEPANDKSSNRLEPTGPPVYG